jgi:hypothetical protein
VINYEPLGDGASSVVLNAECVSCAKKHPVAVKVIIKSSKCQDALRWAIRETKANTKVDYHGNVTFMLPNCFIFGAGLGAGVAAGLLTEPLYYGG